MKTIFIIGCITALAHGFGQQHPRSLPRYYSDLPPHLLPSARPPRTLHHSSDGSSYKTMNPGQMSVNGRNGRQDQSSPQLIASASNTPVLVLKKDHSRPILSSAVAAAVAEKRTQQIAASPQLQQQPHDNKQIPTVIMERPGSPLQPQPQVQQQQKQHQEQTQPSPQQQEEKKHEEDKPQPPPHHHHHQKDKESRHETSLEHDVLSEEEDPHSGGVSSSAQAASAERRMFFNTMSQTSAIAQQMSGPQGPSNPRKHAHSPSPHHHHQQQQQLQQQQRLSPAASSLQHTRAHALHQQRPLPHHPHIEEEEEEPVERIVRSNSPYSNADFQYPPPQGNYIAQGPTRVPVKYQQGVIGIKPQGHPGQGGAGGGGHQQQRGHPGGKPRPFKQRPQQQPGPPGSDEPLSEELEEEEEEAQPDRLQELLATSKFSCDGKKDGYYADDGLQCEVFHYCNAGAKHSWLCPNGFAFHQIHLICVPPSSDNICKQSSNFHFVNEYLYKPINEKEAEVHNATLKYADRYFPDGYNHGAGDVLLPYNNEDDEEDRPVRQHHQQPQYNGYGGQSSRLRPQPHQPQPQPQHQFNPYAQHQQQQPRPHQFSSPSSGGFVPSPHHLQQQNQQRHPSQHPQSHRVHPTQYAQQRSGSSLSAHQISPQKPIQKPSPSKQSLSGGNGNVFFTPDSINIPLQHRRPLPHNPSHHPQMSFRPSPQVSSSSKSEKAHHAQQKQQMDDEYEY